MHDRFVEHFVERFVEAWARPDGSGFAELWHPNGRLEHPSLPAPIAGAEVPAWSERVRASLPGYRFTAESFAARGRLVFLQWRTRATLQGRPLELAGVDRLQLENERIAHEIVYFDTLPLWSTLDPTLARPALMDRAAALPEG